MNTNRSARSSQHAESCALDLGCERDVRLKARGTNHGFKQRDHTFDCLPLQVQDTSYEIYNPGNGTMTLAAFQLSDWPYDSCFRGKGYSPYEITYSRQVRSVERLRLQCFWLGCILWIPLSALIASAVKLPAQIRQLYLMLRV